MWSSFEVLLVKEWYVLFCIAGLALILAATPLGASCAVACLDRMGGLDSDVYITLMRGFITGFQIIGGLAAGVFGLALAVSGRGR